MEKSTQRLHEQFERFSESDNTFRVFPKSLIQDTILHHNARYISKYPWINPTVVQVCQETLHKLRLSASVWDKHPTDLFAMCSGFHAEHIVSAIVLSPSFSLFLVEASHRGANTLIQAEPHRSALEHGILDLARDHKCVGQTLLSAGKWHEHLLACQDVKCFRTKAPSAFQLLKWRSQENHNQLMFRLVISHSKHFLKTFPRLIGRSLSLVLRELHISYPFWGTPSLLGVRYFGGLVATWFQIKTSVSGRDIDNAYWELPKEGVYYSVKQASQLGRANRDMRGNFFSSIAKGGERKLDHIAKAADRGFRAFPLEDVLKFVRWDLAHTTLFEMDGWVLNRNIKGVPIGGVLSAQLMCIRAVVQEITFMQNQVPILRKVRKQWDNEVWPKMTLTPGQQVACSEMAWVPKEVSFSNSHGMDGWFEQTYKLVGTLTLDGHAIALRTMKLWDSHREGRLGHIIR